jgi:hypothetical protein
MNRRSLLRSLSASLVALASRPFIGKGEAAVPAPTGQGVQPASKVLPYFLDSGNLDADEKGQVQQFFAQQEAVLAGRKAGKTRGSRPRGAPTFLFVRWDGELGSPEGRFLGPLSVKPTLDPLPVYSVNAQILALRAASKDWGKTSSRGTLTIELRASQFGEPVTWLYAQQFDLDASGRANIGLEYVAKKNESPSPVVTDRPTVDIRIQLMRQRSSSTVLKTILRVCATIVGLPTGAAAGSAEALVAQVLPAIRIPQLFQEGVALSQAVFGSLAEETPLWSSGFNSYAIARSGGMLGIAPGLWVVIDESHAAELTGARLEDVNGQVTLTKDGAAIDANYLVLALEIGEGQPPAQNYYYYTQPEPTPEYVGSAQQ